MLRASVIIVNFNHLDVLLDCISSLQPTISENDEVIVVDNASECSSKETICSIYRWVRVIESPCNLGYGGGNNLGAQHAKGKYLAFLNPDTALGEGWLDILIETLATGTDIGLVTPKILLQQDPSKINTCGNDIHISGLTLCRGSKKPKSDFANFEKVNAISGACFVIEKSWFEKLGGFDRLFFMYLEDTDLSLRSRLAGKNCFNNPKAIVYHNYHLKTTQEKLYYQERNRYLFLLKNFQILTLLMLSPSLLLSEGITWGFLMFKDSRNWKIKINDYRWVIGHWKTIMQKRKSVQSLRRVKDRDLILSHSWMLDYGQADSGMLAAGGHLIFDPLFLIFYCLLYMVIWW
jgi:GT2 family glycosyltransferase